MMIGFQLCLYASFLIKSRFQLGELKINIFICSRLCNISIDIIVDCRFCILKIAIGSQDNNFNVRVNFLQGRNHFHPVHYIHAHICENNIRELLFDFLERFKSVCGFSDNSISERLPGNCKAKAFSNKIFIINNKKCIKTGLCHGRSSLYSVGNSSSLKCFI